MSSRRRGCVTERPSILYTTCSSRLNSKRARLRQQPDPHQAFASFTQVLSQEKAQQYGSAVQTVVAQGLQVFTSAAPVAQVLWVQPLAVMQRLRTQLCPAPQAPHASVPPHPSLRDPQFLPCAAQVVGVQDVQTLLLQVCPVPQVPHASVPPHPSLRDPQFLPCAAQVVGVHDVQTLLVQVCPVPQVPHVSVPPQPFGVLPQLNPCAAQLVGVHPHTEHIEVASLTQVESQELLQQ
jgi:hypothetical protein